MPEFNPLSEDQIRYAHCDGYTDFCYDDTGKYLLTSGVDGDVRVWKGFDDDDPVSHKIGECAYAVTCKKGKFYAAAETNSVLAYMLDGSPEGIVTRFTASVNHLDCSDDGKLLVAGGGDFTIKVVDLEDSSFKMLLGHDAPLLTVRIDPKQEYVASSSCDGTVRIWRISDQKSVKTWNILPKSNDFCMSKTMCRLSWFPKDGKYLAVPVGNEIHIYEKETWEQTMVFKEPGLTEVYSISCFSPKGTFLAGVTVDGKILVWNFKSKKCISCKQHPKKLSICNLMWNPSGENEVGFCDMQGHLGVIPNVTQMTDAAANDDDLANMDFDADEITSDGKSINASKNKKNKKLVIDDDDEDDEDMFDIGAIKSQLEPKIFGDLEDDGDDNQSVGGVPAAQLNLDNLRIPSGPPPPLLQSPFQPSSTPVHLQHRFMVWNNVGLIRAHNTEEENSIDVEFHDVSVHHAMHISNVLNNTVATLSVEAVVLGCPSNDDVSSKLTCMHFGLWDSSKEWILDMPQGEDILAIAIGKGWTAVATDKRFVRIYTIGGVQRDIFSLPGPVVCMSGHEDHLSVIYHRSGGFPEEQCLGILLMRVFSKREKPVILDMPLSPKSTLSWAGFTDEGSPCTVDSVGVVRLLQKNNSNLWIPVANTQSHTKGKNDHYFVVGISEILLQIRCILCKGARYPPTLPHPTVTVLPLQMPLCEPSSDKGKLEEEYLKLQFLLPILEHLKKEGFEVDSELESSNKKLLDVLLRMFALSCRAEREIRAVEIAEMMPSERALQGAIQYSVQTQHLELAQRLGEIAQKKQQEMLLSNGSEELFDADEEPEEEEIIRPSKRTLPSLPRDSLTTIQPKPLHRMQSNELSGESRRNENKPALVRKEETPTFLLSKGGGGGNPFKLPSVGNTTKSSKSSGDVDFLLHNSCEKLKQSSTKLPDNDTLLKPKGPKQMKLISKTKASKSKKEDANASSNDQQNEAKQTSVNKIKAFMQQNKGDDDIGSQELFEKASPDEEENASNSVDKDDDAAKRKHQEKPKAKDVPRKKTKTEHISSETTNKLSFFSFSKK